MMESRLKFLLQLVYDNNMTVTHKEKKNPQN